MMPTLDQVQMYNNSIYEQYVRHPKHQEQPMFLANEHSTLRDAMDNTSPFVANFIVSALKINMVL
jgi:hypothetical protein